jgi:hypothetical protein
MNDPSYKSVIKKEEKNSREIRGGEDLSTGVSTESGLPDIRCFDS